MPPLVHGVYGKVPDGLVECPDGSLQCSPRVPGCTVLSDLPPASCPGLIVHAPASTIERRHVLALALRALVPGGDLTVLAANSKGGMRLADELTAFGCGIAASHRRHYQIMRTQRPTHVVNLDDAIEAGSPRLLPELGLWSQPGVFSWDRIDPGSQLLLDHLPVLTGHGADLGCGIGVLARAIRHGAEAPRMTLIDIDQRALAMARCNVPGDGVTLLWADVRTAPNLPAGLDFVVMNPPFHDGDAEDRALGQACIQKASAMLRPNGVLWLTANRHLPYEATLKPLFRTVDQLAQANGYKIFMARKASATARDATTRGRR